MSVDLKNMVPFPSILVTILGRDEPLESFKHAMEYGGESRLTGWWFGT